MKIGDLGMAAIVEKDHVAHSLLCTPEFMALELYEEEYVEQVDIYAFHLCVLELVTLELPYGECDSVAKIYHKVSAGIRSVAHTQSPLPGGQSFIEHYLDKPRARPSTTGLLKDPFFFGLDDVPPQLSSLPTIDSVNPDSLSPSAS